VNFSSNGRRGGEGMRSADIEDIQKIITVSDPAIIS
jgi:hypothetical protein